MIAWRSEVFNLILEQPILEFNEIKADTDSIINISILYPSTKQPMTFEDIMLIFKAMSTNLKGKFDWEKVKKVQETIDKDLEPHSKKVLSNQKYMDDILSHICHLGQPVKFSDSEGLLPISLDCESYKIVSEDVEKDRFLNVNDEDKIVKKMAFLAYNFDQVKEMFANEENDTNKAKD